MEQKRFERVTSVPNLLTASRIVAAPLLAFAVLAALPPYLAAALVVVAALTDFIDGRLARAGLDVSGMGAVLDPIADKIFIVTALILLLAEGVLTGINVWAVLIILWREFLISGLRDYARIQGASLPVTPLAKGKTAMQFASVIFLFAARVSWGNAETMFYAGAALLWTAAALTLYTGVDYLRRTWRQAWK
jgi:cardiolipin synthase (CMP-forming)